jgi:hypothetical protein
MHQTAFVTLPCGALLGFVYGATALLLAAAVPRRLPAQPFSGMIVLLSELVQLLVALSVAAITARADSDVGRAEHVELLPEKTSQSGRKRLNLSTHKHQLLHIVLFCGIQATCRCVALNLSFLAIRHLPAYAYVLLQGLEAPLTGMLAATASGTPCSAQQQLGLMICLVAAGVGCVPSWYAGNSYPSHPTALGLVLMLLVVGSNAMARACGGWIQAHSYGVPVQLQSMWLHTAGAVLNGSVYIVQVASSNVSGAGGFIHLQPLHWGVVAALSVLGCVGSATPYPEPR